jgi:hypothetical protein
VACELCGAKLETCVLYIQMNGMSARLTLIGVPFERAPDEGGSQDIHRLKPSATLTPAATGTSNLDGENR